MKFKIEGELDEGEIVIRTPDGEWILVEEDDPKAPDELPKEDKKPVLKAVGGKK